MANTTITKPSGGTVILQDSANSFIASNLAQKESVLVTLPLYGKDSSETDVLVYGGSIKTITIDGKYYGTLAQCKTFIDSCESLIQGKQMPSEGYPLTLVDDLRGTVLVKVMTFYSTFVENSGGSDACFVTWTLKLVESGGNG